MRAADQQDRPVSLFADEISGRQVAKIIALLTLVRLVLAAFVPLGVDESYAVAVSRSLALSYFDHPPMAFTLGRLSALLFESEAPVIVRLPFVLLAAGTSWLIFDLTRLLFSGRAGLWALFAHAVTPFFVMSSFGYLPDGPLLFFLLATARAVLPLMMEQRDDLIAIRWIAAGIFFGAALLSKYHAVLFAIAALIAMIRSPLGRAQLARFWPYLAAVIALILFLPVLVWNYQHGFASISFQAARAASGDGRFGLQGANLLRMIGGQLLYFLPLWFWLPGIVRNLRQPGTSAGSILAVLALFPVAFILIAAALSRGSLPHWTSAGWIFALPLVGAAIDQLPNFSRRRLGRAFSAIGGLIAVAAAGAAVLGSGLVPLPGGKTGFNIAREMGDFRFLSEALKERGIINDPSAFLVVNHWALAGKVSAATGGTIPLFVAGRDPRHFGYMPDERIKGRTIAYYLVASEPEKAEEAAKYLELTLPKDGQTLSIEPPIEDRRGDKVVLSLAVIKIMGNPPKVDP